MARYLQPELYGKYSFLLSFSAILIPFTSLGLNAIITREIVNGKNYRKVLFNAISMRLLGGVSILLVGILIVSFFSNDDLIVDKKFILFSLLINVFAALYAIEYYFLSEVKSKFISFCRLFTIFVVSIVRLWAVYSGKEIEFFYYTLLGETVLRGTLYYLIYVYYVNRKGQKLITGLSLFDKNYSLELLSQSKWLIMSGFMSIIYLKIDQLMIGQMSGAKELGVYAVAARLSEVWYFFPVAIASSFFPQLLKKKDNTKSYHQQLKALCSVLFWCALLVAIFITFISPWFIPLAFGEGFSASIDILNIHIWAGCFIFLRAVLSKWLLAEGLLKFSLLTHGLAAIVNISLNLYLIPIFGGKGAAIATLISYGCSSYIVLWLREETRVMARIMNASVIYPFEFAFKRFKKN